MFDIQYILFVMIPGLIISGGASLLVKAAFNRYSTVTSRR
ncbi:MAG: zinc metallopeptidase, partial [Fuerstiella sp.]|nr:zinc metallopeptidase [Fuerstiella sp.]